VREGRCSIQVYAISQEAWAFQLVRGDCVRPKGDKTMTTLDFDATSLRTPSREAVSLRAVKWIVSAYTNWQNRRAFYRLGEMSDTELHDIGLTRGDLSVAVSLANDPTSALGAIANSRRENMEPFSAMRV